MALFADRRKETSASSGTGNITLAGAVPGFLSLNAGFGTGVAFDYAILHQNNKTWEIGVGQLSAASTFVRTTVYANSLGTTAKIDFATGGLFVLATPSAYSLNNGLFPGGMTVGGQAIFAAGAVGAPAITTLGDLNTGVYFPAADTVAGVEAWRANPDATLNIGGVGFTGASVSSQKNITGAVSAYGFTNWGTVQSGVTTQANYYHAAASTAVASFTVTAIRQFYATQGTIGAGSTVTNQYGFAAENSLTGATNNYAFYSNLAAATGRWNFFANGTADNYMAGSLGLGTTASSVSGKKLAIGGSSATAASAFSWSVDVRPTFQSDVTSGGFGVFTQLATAAAVFTLGDITHFYAQQGTFGAGSTVTVQHGFRVDATLIGAATNYGFRGTIAASTNRWNIYMDGTAANYFAGAVGIGSTSLTGYSLLVARTITGATTAFGISSNGIVQSDVTAEARLFAAVGTTVASAFTLSDLRYYTAFQGTFGAGSTVTNQVGFYVGANLAGATSNFGFHSNIAADVLNDWNFYAAGTAPNYMAGNLGIGSTNVTQFNLRISGSITGATASQAVRADGTIQSGVTSSAAYFSTAVATAVASFTVTDLFHFIAAQGTFGVGSTVTSQYGFLVGSSLTGATNNYAFRHDLSAGSGRWGFYGGGTADNYLGGSLGIGTTSLTGYSLRIGANITGATTSMALRADGVIQSGVTASAVYFRTVSATAAAAFTVSDLFHFSASQGTIGATSTVTAQYGFFADASLTGAASNFAFYGNIAAGANRYNIYMGGTAANYMAGALGIGSTPSAAATLYLAKTITGGVSAQAVAAVGTIQSDVITNGQGFATFIGTQATSFTLSVLSHFIAQQGTIGATSAVTTQYGFSASSTLTGATNNFGFHSAITPAAGRFAFFDAGGATSYFAGDHQFDKTITAALTTGAQTINKNAGSINFAAAATSLVVTNSRVTVNSVITATVATNDSTMKSVAVVAGAGSFTLHANAAATAETRVNFIVIN
jgi:hypothetical protein